MTLFTGETKSSKNHSEVILNTIFIQSNILKSSNGHHSFNCGFKFLLFVLQELSFTKFVAIYC